MSASAKGLALGAALVGVHGALLVSLARSPAPSFEILVAAEPARASLDVRGEVPAALRDKVARVVDELPPGAPGLRRVRWRAEYRGGHVRSVGVSQLVGPFQRPGELPCAGRVVLAQALFDDGAASPGTLAALARGLIERELAGQGTLPTGDFRRLDGLAVRLAEPAAHPEDAQLFDGDIPSGYLRVTAAIVFERLAVPVVLGIVPQFRDGALQVRLAAQASLTFESRLAQWLSDTLGGDRLATSLAQRKLADLALAPLAAPPPVALPGGGALRFAPCAAPQLREGSHAVVPFSVEVVPLPGRPHHLPPRLGEPPPPTAAQLVAGLGPRSPLALELPLDTLNALLYGAWREGLLDRQLAAARLTDKLHADPTVATFLSLRLAPPTLPLPPVVVAHRGALRVLAEGATEVIDGATRTPARVWTAFSLRATTGSLRAELAELELTCAPRPGVLAPCYADIVEAARARAADFTAPLSDALAMLLAELFAQRTLGAPEVPAQLEVVAASPSVRAGERANDGVLRLTFQATLRAAP